MSSLALDGFPQGGGGSGLLGALGVKYPDSPVLLDDNFSDGLAGWTQLYETGSSTPHPGPTLCSYPAMDSPFSMRYGTGNIGSSTIKDGYDTIAKRLTLPANTGTITYEIWWAWGAALAVASPLYYGFWLDIQSWDGTKRSNYILRWYNRDPATGNARTQWAICDDSQAVVWIPDAVVVNPFNENKANWIYTKFTVDIAGGYRTLTTAGKTFDLSGLGAGTGNITTVTNFNGGLNFLADVTNRNAASLGQAWAFMGRVRGSYAA